jgi:hypothetical protein
MYSIGRPREQKRARRGPGVAEYTLVVTPTPTNEVRGLYNAMRPSGWPKLTDRGLLLLCDPAVVDERVEQIAATVVARLDELAEESAVA